VIAHPPFLVLVAAAGALCAACASAPLQGVTEAFAANPPRSIIVLAPTCGDDAGAARRVEGLLRDGLKHKGYRLTHPADATLSTRIELWDRQLSGSTGTAPERVSLSAELVSGGGIVLWRGEAYRRIEDEEKREKGRGGALGWIDSAYDYLFETISDPLIGDHEEVAEEAVADLLATLPRAPSP
jgi:hypothetical protein